MPISLTNSRPKLATTNNTTNAVEAQTPVESGNSILIPITFNDLTPPAFTVASVTTTNSSATVTASSGAFDNVRIGDVVQKGSDIPATTYVTAKTSTSLTLSAAATATNTGTLNVTPGAIDATVYILELTHAASGSAINVTPKIHLMNGLKVSDTTNANYDNAGVADAVSSVTYAAQSINVDTFLTNARVAKTNS